MRFDSELFPSPVSLAAPSNDPPGSKTHSGTRRRARLHHWQLAVAADSLAAITRLNNHIGCQIVRIGCALVLFAGRSMQFMAIDTLSMINRSSIAAAQQLFVDTAPTLVANIEALAKLAVYRNYVKLTDDIIVGLRDASHVLDEFDVFFVQ
jgi:hypothetical protein